MSVSGTEQESLSQADGDAPLLRAALSSDRVPMMELLVAHGADVNAAWHGDYPILFAACETLSPGTLHWLLEHRADPNCGNEASWKTRGIPHPGTALDYLLGTNVFRTGEQRVRFLPSGTSHMGTRRTKT
jgi:ankyrin repeat protein